MEAVWHAPVAGRLRFDPDRVAHYRSLLDEPATFPRALAYDIGGSMALLLDGHHKATACALAGRRVPCLVIQLFTGLHFEPTPSDDAGRIHRFVASLRHRYPKPRLSEVQIGGFRVAASDLPAELLAQAVAKCQPPWCDDAVTLTETRLINMPWPTAYQTLGRRYPDVYDFGEAMVAASSEFDLSLVEHWLDAPAANVGNLRAALLILRQLDPARARQIALIAARARVDKSLTLLAFRTLDAFDDDDVDQLFIDELVTNDDRHDQLRQIADHHWDRLS